MDSPFLCKNAGRRKAVASPMDAAGNPVAPTLNGIDYLEIASPDQKTLKIYFLHPLPGETSPVPPGPAPSLKKENIRIEGGVRIRNIRVEKIGTNKNVLTVRVNESGDFSTYQLRIITSPADPGPPTGFDPQLSAVAFSFKVSCPAEFDCQARTECPPETLEEPDMNYLVKDYAGFRRLMLDRLSVIMPDWQERNPADLQIALVELLAYVGDHLSYFQDAVATEAYLGTARKRISMRRHARLLDYLVHDGCNARVWVCVRVEDGGDADGKKLLKGTPLLTKGPSKQIIVAGADLQKILEEEKPLVFETMHDVTLHSTHNRISFYTWNDSECCLPRGSNRATLRRDPALFLKRGDVLLFEEVCNPVTGTEADADPARRHAVRLKEVTPSVDPLDGTEVLEIAWHETDALPFPLCISALIDRVDGKQEWKEISVVRGNCVLTDHGYTSNPELKLPPEEPVQGYYGLKLPHGNITFSVPYDHESAMEAAASSISEQDPRKALPSRMSLRDADETWTVQRELLGSDRFRADFVVEMERDGEAHLRFGDGAMGKKPSGGTTFAATYRIGNGRPGNVGAEALTRLVTGFKGISGVRNPIPAGGGVDAETMEEVRLFAPQAFRSQERAVTEADYAEVTERHPEVQKAAATFRWTGSWYTVFVTIDRRGGRDVDETFKAAIRTHLEQSRLAGYDLEINGPVFVPLDILVLVCVKPGYFKSHIKENLLKSFSNHEDPDGRRGFFHPDHFTFGHAVYLSRLYQRAMEVTGVASLEIRKFQRWGKTPQEEKEKGFLKPEALEVVRLDNDPNFPENGKIDFDMQGGL